MLRRALLCAVVAALRMAGAQACLSLVASAYASAGRLLPGCHVPPMTFFTIETHRKIPTTKTCFTPSCCWRHPKLFMVLPCVFLYNNRSRAWAISSAKAVDTAVSFDKTYRLHSIDLQTMRSSMVWASDQHGFLKHRFKPHHDVACGSSSVYFLG